MGNNNTFQRVSKDNYIGRSLFDNSYSKVFDCNFGELIPVAVDEYEPGAVVDYSAEMLIRFQPLVSPVMHEINAYIHYFFVPYRILEYGSFDWEEFITGGEDGTDSQALVRWEPSSAATSKYSLWDYFGFPIGYNHTDSTMSPTAFPLWAYNTCWNEWYRDQNLQTARTIGANTVAMRNWSKDYFTSSLPWQEKNTSPSLPFSGTSSAQWATSPGNGDFNTSASGIQGAGVLDVNGDTDLYIPSGGTDTMDNIKGFFNKNTVDLSGASLTIHDIRETAQIQKWMELNARGGSRYTEWLQAHHNVTLPDYTSQRPEYIGGVTQAINISEVLQTSATGDGTGETDTPQGTLAGHAISADSNYVGRYRVKEYGVVIGLMSVMPKPAYSQGIDRQWLQQDRYDFYHQEFANLSEQPVFDAELYATGASSNDDGTFGYQGAYNHFRSKKDQYCGNLRDTLDYWHLGRIFAGKQTLNSSFLECDSTNDDLTRIFAVPAERGIICHVNNKIKAWRPMPIEPIPGIESL